MTQIEIPLKFDNFPKQSEELRILKEVNDCRAEAGKLMADERVMDALQKSIEGLRVMREFPDFNNTNSVPARSRDFRPRRDSFPAEGLQTE